MDASISQSVSREELTYSKIPAINEPVLEKKDRIRGLELKRVEHAEFYRFIKELVSERREYKIVLSEFTKQ